MSKIRVLIVDDSVVVRRLLGDALRADPAIEVAGIAPNGQIALARLPQLTPDLVTLDLEMPDMDGLATLRAIRAAYPALPVLMVSRYTQRLARATLDALALGASDYLTLPDHGGLASATDWIKEQLIPRIKQFGKPGGQPSSPILVPSRPSSPGFAPRSRVEVVAIGSSTGGPQALAAVLSALPIPFPVPVVIAQHMPPEFTRQLAERLARLTSLVVREAVPDALLEPGDVWVARGGLHLVAVRDHQVYRLRLLATPPENSCRPSADVLFRSVAEAFGGGVLGVVLTGMGQDGLRGCEAIRAAGGQVLTQDKATSVVWGMPGAVTEAGLSNQVLPLDEIGPEIGRRVRRGRSILAFRPPVPALPSS
jgi:two-component system, chemotaxis family, protein-glutamate methylesterase/glutaminase